MDVFWGFHEPSRKMIHSGPSPLLVGLLATVIGMLAACLPGPVDLPEAAIGLEGD